jgi:hypothetical protein
MTCTVFGAGLVIYAASSNVTALESRSNSSAKGFTFAATVTNTTSSVTVAASNVSRVQFLYDTDIFQVQAVDPPAMEIGVSNVFSAGVSFPGESLSLSIWHTTVLAGIGSMC